MTGNVHRSTRAVAIAVAIAAAPAAGCPTPAHAAVPSRYVVEMGHSCSGAVLNTTSGSWLLTARHCSASSWVQVGARRFAVVRRVDRPGSLPANDLALVKVRGSLKAAAGGGFAVGRGPARGSRVSVQGFPGGSTRLVGCARLAVTYYRGYPEVRHCYLPNGTSGGPWYTPDVVLRGVVGGIDNGGRSNYITNTVPFTADVVRWVLRNVN